MTKISKKSIQFGCVQDVRKNTGKIQSHRILYSVENEYQIPYNEDIERRVEEMCNASQGVLNKCIEIGMSTSEIAAKMNISEKEVNDQ